MRSPSATLELLVQLGISRPARVFCITCNLWPVHTSNLSKQHVESSNSRLHDVCLELGLLAALLYNQQSVSMGWNRLIAYPICCSVCQSAGRSVW